MGEDASVGEGRRWGGKEGAEVGEEDAGVGEGDIGVGEGAAVVGEEDAGVGEDAAAVGQGGSEVCGGRAEGGEERRRWLTALRSAVGARDAPGTMGEERERRGAAAANVWRSGTW